MEFWCIFAISNRILADFIAISNGILVYFLRDFEWNFRHFFRDIRIWGVGGILGHLSLKMIVKKLSEMVSSL